MNKSTFASINIILHVATSSEVIYENTNPKCLLR